MDQNKIISGEEKGKKIKEEPFVSVLTPVYNDEKYLRECIESVLNQTYSNWEYVFVNNQSKDHSLEIIQEYAERDSRIRIHNNIEFLPQMKNLNHSFRQISPESKYCKVLHADDWLFPECISKMVEVAEQYPSIGIVSSYRLLGDKVGGMDGVPYPDNFFNGKEIARQYLLHSTSNFGAPSSLLIRSDLIREREKVYEESHQASDTGACLELLKKSDFGFVHQILTCTRLHEESITNTEAKESYAFIHARLFMQLTYGPYYLTEKEYKSSVSKKINLFYVVLAKNILQKRSIDEFKKQSQILGKIGLGFEMRRFLKNVLRELFLKIFSITGMELKRGTDSTRKYDVSLS